MGFGEYLKELRKKRKLVLKQIDDHPALRVSGMAFNQWETGRFLPEPEKLPGIKKLLQLDEGDYLILSDWYWKERRSRDLDRHFSAELSPAIERELERLKIYKVPLYGPKDTVDPMAVIRKEQRWKGRYADSPPVLQASRAFAFAVKDTAMAPRYNPDDILFCDLDLVKEEGNPFVACVKGEVFCRIYERQGPLCVFKALDPKKKLVTATKKGVKWYYRVSRRESDEREWTRLDRLRK